MEKFLHKTDDYLLEAFQSGDRQAYEAIYDRYWQILFRFARKMLQDDTVAKDVVQEVFTVLWVKVNEVTIKPPLAAYLYTLTRHKILDLVKHTKVENKYLKSLRDFIQSTEAIPDRLYIEKQLFDQIEREIQSLPEKMRIVFEKSRKEYKSNKEIAKELGIAEKTVKNQITNAIRILKDKLGDSANIFLIFF